jgi:hypothetical protein
VHSWCAPVKQDGVVCVCVCVWCEREREREGGIAAECLRLLSPSYRFTCQLPYYTQQPKQLASASYYLPPFLTSLQNFECFDTYRNLLENCVLVGFHTNKP